MHFECPFLATSALDNVSERVVQEALDKLQAEQPRTTLVVAHRLGTIKNCNRIAVLDDGGVAELGSHDELLKQDGLYHELWMKQGAAEEEDGDTPNATSSSIMSGRIDASMPGNSTGIGASMSGKSVGASASMST